jgi:hypothetical protein
MRLLLCLQLPSSNVILPCPPMRAREIKDAHAVHTKHPYPHAPPDYPPNRGPHVTQRQTLTISTLQQP